jgi:DNA-binding MarR family transcriptional regulator
VLLSSIRRIIRAVDLYSKELLKEFGMTGPQLTLLKAIHESRHLSVSEVASSISLSQATVTNIVARLEQQGYVTRRRSTSDRRRVYVEVSEKTRELLESTPCLLRKDFVDRFNRLEGWEQSLLLSSLQRIAAMMDGEDDEAAVAHPPDRRGM